MFFIKQPTVVPNVSAGVMTSLPSGKLKDSIPIYKAEDPEFTYRHDFLSKSSTILDSNYVINKIGIYKDWILLRIDE